MPVIVLHSR